MSEIPAYEMLSWPQVIDVSIVELDRPLFKRADGVLVPAGLRDAVAGGVYRFGIYMEFNGCGVPLLRYYAPTREAAEAAVTQIKARKA